MKGRKPINFDIWKHLVDMKFEMKSQNVSGEMKAKHKKMKSDSITPLNPILDYR